MRNKLCIVFWLFLGLMPVLADGPLCVQLELRREKSVAGAPAPSSATIPVRVVLADDYLEFEDDEGRVVHDFVSKQSHLVKGTTYARRSLYADIGFRVSELRNRTVLIEALKAKPEAGKTVGDVVAVEHLFSVDDEVTDANIVKADGKKSVVYTHAVTRLAEFSTKGRKITPAQSKAFVRFLRYYSGGHPDILAEVRALNRLPEDFSVVVSNLDNVESFNFHVKSVEECHPARPDFSAMTVMVLPPDPIGALVALALKVSPAAVAEGSKTLLAKADAAIAKGNLLEAALAYFEILLMQGGEVPAGLAQHRAAFDANPDTSALFTALAQGGQTTDVTLATLTALEPKAGSEAHVLKIFRAGLMSATGKKVEARDLYVEALTVNPAIAGAWKDLGDIYHANYETDMAWLCWDVGRKLSPQHGMLADVTKLEEVLRANNPGFF